MHTQQHSPDSFFAKLLALKGREFLYKGSQIKIVEVNEMEDYFLVSTSKHNIKVENTKFEINEFLSELNHVTTIANNQKTIVKSEMTLGIENFFGAQMQKINEGRFSQEDMLAIRAVSIMTDTVIRSKEGELKIKILDNKLRSL